MSQRVSAQGVGDVLRDQLEGVRSAAALKLSALRTVQRRQEVLERQVALAVAGGISPEAIVLAVADATQGAQPLDRAMVHTYYERWKDQ